ncbi:MAG TPA: IclR family transcriptional regulator C-terminal domain-containing protein, partial [Acidimicrobiales bacterium]|nr:IclR family transcriptional regulator C-terminal domain-containing protein [Acidimicrobiales bacterium]
VVAPHALAIVLGAMRREGLRASLLPALSALRERSGETTFLALPDGSRVVLAEVVESAHVVRVAVPLGSSAPAADSSAGLAMAAFLAPPQRSQLLGGRRADAAEDLLVEVRRQGYAIRFKTVRSDIHTVAVPVFDRHGAPVAAVGIAAPADRLQARDARRLGRVAAAVVDDAGYGPPAPSPGSKRVGTRADTKRASASARP